MGYSVVKCVKLQKFEKILLRKKKTILTEGYELPLNAFQIFSVSKDVIEF
jgi:hypothetical protein